MPVTNKSDLSPKLKGIRSDLVYPCQMKGCEGYLPILFLTEHPSTADKQMAFRMFQYTIALMEDDLKAGHEHLPWVLPRCVDQGEKSPYPYSCDIDDDFKDTPLAKALVFQPFRLIDRTTLSLEVLEQHGMVAMKAV